MTPGRTLEDLFESYRTHGDLAAFEELYDRLLPELSMYCALRTGRRDRVGDVLNETWLELVTRPERFEAGRSFAAYALGIARNKARHVLWRDTRGGGDDGTMPEPGSLRDAHADVEAREIRQLVEACIARVREPYASVLRQHLIEGRSPLEIAVRMRIRPGTVGMRIARGLERLRAVLPAGLAGAAVFGIGLDAAAQTRGFVLESARQKALARAALGAGAAGGASMSVSTGALVAGLGLWGALAACLMLAFALVWFAEPASQAALAGGEGGDTALASAARASVEPLPGALDPRPADSARVVESGIRTAATGAPAYVRVVLTGVSPHDLPGFAYEARLGWQETILPALWQDDGSVLLDVRGLEPAAVEAARNEDPADDPADELGIRVTHPLYWGQLRQVSWSAALAATTPDGAPRVEFVLHARGFVHGRVVVDGPDAEEELGKLHVRLLDSQCREIESLGYAGPTLEAGELKVPVRDPGVYQIELTSRGSSLPRTLEVLVPIGVRTDLKEIHMSSGAPIEGRVELGALGVEAIESIYVIPQPVGSRWHSCDPDAHPMRSLDRYRVSKDGTFAIAGLEPGRYELALYTHVVDQLVPQLSPAKVVEAPARHVVLGDDCCFVDVEVLDPFHCEAPPSDEAGPCVVCQREHIAADPHAPPKRRSEGPRIRAISPPESDRTAIDSIVPSHHEPIRARVLGGTGDGAYIDTFSAYPSGVHWRERVQVPLRDRGPTPMADTYEVEVVGTPRIKLFLGQGRSLRLGGAGLTRLTVRAEGSGAGCEIAEVLHYVRPATAEEAVEPERPGPDPARLGRVRFRVSAEASTPARVSFDLRDAHGGDLAYHTTKDIASGWVELEMLTGSYAGEVRNNESLDPSRPQGAKRKERFSIPLPLEFSVMAGEVREVLVEFSQGGLLRLDGAGAAADLVPVEVRLVDAQGPGGPLTLEQMGDGDPGDVARVNVWDPTRPATVDRALAPGRYRLEFREPGATRLMRSVEVELIAGRITDVLVPFGH